MDEQLTLNFQIPIVYEKYSGICKCSYKWEYQRCSIVLDMKVICPGCKSIIQVGDTKRI